MDEDQQGRSKGDSKECSKRTSPQEHWDTDYEESSVQMLLCNRVFSELSCFGCCYTFWSVIRLVCI